MKDDVTTQAALGGLRLAMLIALVVFIVFAAELHFSQSIALDMPVMRGLRDLRSPQLSAAMLAITHLGDGEVLTVATIIAAVVFAARRHFRSSLFIILSSSGAALINRGLKIFFQRERPDLAIVDASGFAFPSGHSMGSAALYGGIALIIVSRFPTHRRRLVALCLTIVGAVGFSRAYLHVHFPSDVLAGWSLGFAWALWLKPLVLGPGFEPADVPAEDLAEDHFEEAAPPSADPLGTERVTRRRA